MGQIYFLALHGAVDQHTFTLTSSRPTLGENSTSLSHAEKFHSISLKTKNRCTHCTKFNFSNGSLCRNQKAKATIQLLQFSKELFQKLIHEQQVSQIQ